MSIVPLARQRQAIEAELGPVLVVAGPGAGKTFCLIGRVEYLIETLGFAPERVCAVTFTNKAAEEIAARLKGSLGHRAADTTRGTLHSLCVEILREHGEVIGLRRGFGIADEEYQRLVLRQMGVPVKRIGDLLNAFSLRRLQGRTLSDEDEVLYRRYWAELREKNVVDFDDLIAETALLLDKHPGVRGEVASRWDYVLVDELQDLNPAQFSIIRHLVEGHRNVFGVGDEEQSIFSWTGADPEILRRFQHDFDIDEPIVLDENRRCSRQIFGAARRLLGNNPSLFEKDLRTERESAFEVAAAGFDDEQFEAEWILRDLLADRDRHGKSWGQYGVLYRKHKSGDYLERAMIRAGIPCRLAKGRSLQDNKVVAAVVASLRVIAAPKDSRLVELFAENVLPRHLIEQVRAQTSDTPLEFLESARLFARRNAKSHPDTKMAWRFVYHVENLHAMGKSYDSVGALVAELLAHRVGKYRNALEKHYEALSDPATDVGVLSLAAKLRLAATAGSTVWLGASGGVDLALKEMLHAAGFPAVRYMEVDGTPEADDVTIDERDAGSNGLSISLFKALQLIHSNEFKAELSDYVTFDLETTDKDVDDCDIIEIGAAKVLGGEVVDVFHSLVRPSKPISTGAREVHGYGDDDVKDAPVLEDVWPAFREFVGERVLVAHNAHRFDVPVLRRAVNGLEGIESMLFYDTLPLATSLVDGSRKLEDMAREFGVDSGRAHHAQDDAVTLARVFGVLSRKKVVRARKTALVNLLDYLGLGIALDTPPSPTAERELLFDIAKVFALGRYSDCLEHYGSERSRLGTRRTPTVEDVIERLGGQKLMDRLRAQPDPARRYPHAVAKLDALVEGAHGHTLNDQLTAFLERVVLSTSRGADVDPHRVNLLTLHATKGLEFSRVYVTGVEDYEIPGYYAAVDNREGEIQEARRLLYVGMTRAEDRLVLTRAERRFGNDTGGTKFLDELGLDVMRFGAEAADENEAVLEATEHTPSKG